MIYDSLEISSFLFLWKKKLKYVFVPETLTLGKWRMVISQREMRKIEVIDGNGAKYIIYNKYRVYSIYNTRLKSATAKNLT